MPHGPPEVPRLFRWCARYRSTAKDPEPPVRGNRWTGPGPEQEQPLLLDPRLGFLFRRRARLIAGFGQHPGTLADAEHVEDEGHAAVAHDGRAGVHGEPFQLLAQRLDHDFLGVVDSVYHRSEE